MRWGKPYDHMASKTDDLEKELQRNFRLRRELGVEVRLELLTTDAPDKRDADDPQTLTRLVGAAWIAVGLFALALAAFMGIWVT
jgi:hypothetical protein